MTNITNLNQFRKKQAKEQKQKTAQQNRIKHGLTKAQKNLNKSQSDLENSKHNQTKRTPTPDH